MDGVSPDQAKVAAVVMPKLSVALARIALRDWPQHYPDFFSRLEALVGGSECKGSQRMGLQLLVMVLEEFPLGPDGTRGGVSGECQQLHCCSEDHMLCVRVVVGRKQKWRTVPSLVPAQKANPWY